MEHPEARRYIAEIWPTGFGGDSPLVNDSCKSRSIGLNSILYLCPVPRRSRHTVVDTTAGIQLRSIEIVFNRGRKADVRLVGSNMTATIEM